MEVAPPILTAVSPTELECTLHSSRHRCLLRLRSRRRAGGVGGAATAGSAASASRGAGGNGKQPAASPMAVPDISTLCVVPIGADDGRGKSEKLVWLLPKMYHATHLANDGDDGNGGNATSSLPKDHPVHELVRITSDMEGQLKERLKDASDGAMQNDTKRREDVDPSTWFGAQEAFLRRSEAIFQELLSAVGQQLRREESNRSGQSRKRKAAERGGGASLSPPPLTYYSALLHQLQVIQSLPIVTDVSLSKDTAADSNDQDGAADLTRVSVTCLDEKKRSHTWHAELYPSIVLTVDLPSEFVLDEKIRLERWWEEGGDSNSTDTLPKVHQQFEEALQKYQPLFDELDDLDSHLWILEPSLPARRDSVERRIALWEGGASMAIVLDPENARGVPVMVRFLGVTMATMAAAANATKDSGGNAAEVVDWRKSFAAFVSDEDEGKAGAKSSDDAPASESEQSIQKRWSDERSVRENLELWFGAPLPSPLSPSTEKSDFLVECGICYMHRLPTEDESSDEGPLPEAKCGNPSCNRAYHETCLFEWLHSLPTARVSFDRIFGTCPYCCEAVSVKILNAGN